MVKAQTYRDGTTEIFPIGLPSTHASVFIEVLNASSHPMCCEFAKGAIVLGAGLAADVVIDDVTVSRRHAQCAFTEQGIEITDLGSRNGTFYRGQRVKRITLVSDGVIQLGEVHVRVALNPTAHSTLECNVARFGNVTGRSPSTCSLIRTLSSLSLSNVPVLIVGESGTGKGFIARALHEHGIRAHGAFITAICGAIDLATVRNELTVDASTSSPGAFASACGGTLFLDEVGEMPLDVQPLLLRWLETGNSVSANDGSGKKGSARIIASTQRNLEFEVSKGRFRHDLFHCLNVVKLELPPLRERRDDIAHLAHEFAAEFKIHNLSDEIVEQLCRYEWPGNIRELRNILRGYAAVGVLSQPRQNGSDEGFVHLLRVALDMERPYQEQKDKLVNQFIDVYLSELLLRTKGNQSEAARIAGLDRTYLNKMLARLRRTARTTNGSRLERSDKPDL